MEDIEAQLREPTIHPDLVNKWLRENYILALTFKLQVMNSQKFILQIIIPKSLIFLQGSLNGLERK
jgi:hypothetical protein